MASDPFQKQSPIKVRLPHPYLTTYLLERTAAAGKGAASTFTLKEATMKTPETGLDGGKPFPQALHSDKLRFSRLERLEADQIDDANNTPWALARRSPVWTVSWQDEVDAPTLGQVWLFLYTFWAWDDETEQLRLRVEGPGAEAVAQSLLLSMVAVEHPAPVNTNTEATKIWKAVPDEVVVPRSAFWQGCASPLGMQPIWLSTWKSANMVPHVEYTHTARGDALFRHPRRCPKPTPGDVFYSRYIPYLDEHFSLQAVDWTDAEHLRLFNTWQNDPRVAAAWMETGTLDEHRVYLKNIHDDPHQFAVFGCFNGEPFAYFELYWAREDKMGAYYGADDFDRGRHALVGNDKYRGTHRVAAWWPSIIHYEFLDDHRTQNVVGEPRLSNEKITMYEYMFGHHQDKWIDLPHKRSNLVVQSRERFFQLCPFQVQKKRVAGTSFGFFEAETKAKAKL